MSKSFLEKNSLLIIGFGIGLLGGILFGMLFQQMILTSGAVKVAEGLEGTNFEMNVDFNETIIMDEMREILADMNETDNLISTKEKQK